MGNTYDTEIARIEADHIQTKWKTTEDYRWGYTGDRGPETWWVHYPSASGGMQSPVDIITEEALPDTEYGQNPLQICYYVPPAGHGAESGGGEHDSTDEKRILINNGSTLRTNIVNSKSYITGGPCRGYTYVLEQFHIHWGESDSNGSEHFVNGIPYAAEVHLVHWNEDLYSCYEDAVKSDDGIIILAMFLQLSDSRCNDAMWYLSNQLDDIVYRDQNLLLQPQPGEFYLRGLLPDDLNKYWAYSGSFCTPPCYETVTWVVFEKPSYITARALKKLRSLRSYCENEARPADDQFDGQMNANRRPPQPIGTRKILYVDQHIWREHHHPDDGWRPFRCRGVGDGPRITNRSRRSACGRRSERGGGKQPAAGVRVTSLPYDLSQHRRNGVHGG